MLKIFHRVRVRTLIFFSRAHVSKFSGARARAPCAPARARVFWNYAFKKAERSFCGYQSGSFWAKIATSPSLLGTVPISPPFYRFLLNLATADSSLLSISAILTSATSVSPSVASSISRAAKIAVRPLARAPVWMFMLVIRKKIYENHLNFRLHQ